MTSRSTSRHGATASTRTRSKGASGGSRSRASTRPRAGTKSRASSPSRPASSRSGQRRTPRAPWVVPIAIVALIIVAAWSFYPVARVQYREQREKARLESELASLQTRNEKLRDEVDRLKTPEGVEQVARESLGLVKDGESVYVVLDGDEQEATPTTEPQSAVSSEDTATGWQRFLDMVFGIE